MPGTQEEGYQLEWFLEDPREKPDLKPLIITKGTQAQMSFADNLPKCVASGKYWLRVYTIYTAARTTTMQLGLCVLGSGYMYVNDKEVIDSRHTTRNLAQHRQDGFRKETRQRLKPICLMMDGPLAPVASSEGIVVSHGAFSYPPGVPCLGLAMAPPGGNGTSAGMRRVQRG